MEPMKRGGFGRGRGRGVEIDTEESVERELESLERSPLAPGIGRGRGLGRGILQGRPGRLEEGSRPTFEFEDSVTARFADTSLEEVKSSEGGRPPRPAPVSILSPEAETGRRPQRPVPVEVKPPVATSGGRPPRPAQVQLGPAVSSTDARPARVPVPILSPDVETGRRPQRQVPVELSSEVVSGGRPPRHAPVSLLSGDSGTERRPASRSPEAETGRPQHPVARPTSPEAEVGRRPPRPSTLIASAAQELRDGDKRTGVAPGMSRPVYQVSDRRALSSSQGHAAEIAPLEAKPLVGISNERGLAPGMTRPAYQPSDRRAAEVAEYGPGAVLLHEEVESDSFVEEVQNPSRLETMVSYNRGRSSARGVSLSVFHGERTVSSSEHDVVSSDHAVVPNVANVEAPPLIDVPAPPVKDLASSVPVPASVAPTTVAPATPAVAETIIESVSVPGTDTKDSTKKAPLVKKGEKGEFAQLACNFLRVHYDEKRQIQEYHVTFVPNLDGRKQRRAALDQHDNVIGSVKNFDGMKLFLPIRLPEQKMELIGKHPGDPHIMLTTTITFIKESQASDLILFFNILFKRVMLKLSKVELRRAYYDMTKVVQLDQHKLEIWPGFCLAVEYREGGLLLCLDAAHRVLRSETVLQYLESVKGTRENWKDLFSDFIIGKIVLTRYNNMLYKIDDVMWDANPAAVFMRGDKEMSYVDYYSTQHQMRIKDLRQPLLLSKVKPRRTEAGTQEPDRMVALVPELCHVTGLTDEQRSNFTVMKDLGNHTRLPPSDRRKALQDFVTSINGDPAAKQMLTDWNMELDGQPMYIQGRNITGPKLNFGKRDVQVTADFTREATQSCYEPVNIKKYLVICTQRDADKAKRFVDVYRQVATALNIKTLNSAIILPIKGYQVNDFRRAITENLTEEIQFLLVVMPQQRDDVYGSIKKTCVSELAVPSQVVLTKTLSNEKRLKSIVQKIALQINCKLGGSLWALNMPLKEEIMFVGIDVAHDAKRKHPSVLALVVNLDNQCTKYYSLVRVMKVHQEISDHLESAMTEALKAYFEVRGVFPGRIIVWRDGGSIASVEFFKTHEIGQMRKAIDVFCPTALFTFVVIQKRISQRFFKTDRRGERWENPDPGTIIDHTITARYHYDFFVVPQMVRQGTVTPTHYVVIHDTADTKPDLMQKFAYATSFMYFNWSGTIRVPAMTQYAHKLAALVGQYVRAPPGKPLIRTLYYL